jgi:PIN domain nuclease of toxin-antitoxin system
MAIRNYLKIFHRDPADQIIVATARIHDCPLVTQDAKILAYSHVNKPD